MLTNSFCTSTRSTFFEHGWVDENFNVPPTVLIMEHDMATHLSAYAWGHGAWFAKNQTIGYLFIIYLRHEVPPLN